MNKHICLITTSYPDNNPGSEAAGSFVEDIAKALSKSCRVTVIAPSYKARKESHGSLSVHYFPVPRLPLSTLRPTRPSDAIAIISTLRAGKKALWQLCESDHVHHILALWALPSGYWAKSAQRRFGTPYSIWALGSDIWSLGKIPLIRQLLRYVIQHAETCFADGYLLGEDVTRISRRECKFLPSTRDILTKPKTLATQPPYRLAFLGRWHPNKGIDLLLEALTLLAPTAWHSITEIRIHGGGPLAQIVEKGVQTLKDRGYPVTLGSFLDKTQAAELLAWADYLVIPSRIESIPVIFSDAMKLRCPTIVMPVGDMKRLVTELNVGFAAEQISAEHLATAIERALGTPPQAFAKHLVAAAEQFDNQMVADKLIRQLLSK